MTDLQILCRELAEMFPTTEERDTPGFAYSVDGMDTYCHICDGILDHAQAIFLGTKLPPYQQALIEKTLELICKQEGWGIEESNAIHKWDRFEGLDTAHTVTVWTSKAGHRYREATRLEALARASLAANRGV